MIVRRSHHRADPPILCVMREPDHPLPFGRRAAPVLAALLAATTALPAAAENRASAALLQGWSEADGARIAALDISLAPGWKTYWRNPGDAGIPPSLDWSGSENVASVEPIWPRPHAFEFYGLRTFGYKHELVLPLRVVPTDPAQPVSLRLSVDYGVCGDICVAERAELSARIDAGEGAEAQRIRAAMAQRIETEGVTMEHCALSGAGEARRLRAALRPARPFTTPPHAVLEAGDAVWFAPAEVTIEDGAVMVEAALETATPGAWVSRDSVRVTLLTEDAAYTAAGCSD